MEVGGRSNVRDARNVVDDHLKCFEEWTELVAGHEGARRRAIPRDVRLRAQWAAVLFARVRDAQYLELRRRGKYFITTCVIVGCYIERFIWFEAWVLVKVKIEI